MTNPVPVVAQIKERFPSGNIALGLSLDIGKYELCPIVSGPLETLTTFFTPVKEPVFFSRQEGQWGQSAADFKKEEKYEVMELYPGGIRMHTRTESRSEGIDLIFPETDLNRLREWLKSTYVLFEDNELSSDAASLRFEIPELKDLSED